MPTETLVVKDRFTPLDLLLWRRFHREYHGIVEATLDTNYGLADKGGFLPVGTKVVVQLPNPSDAVPKPVVVRLYS